MRSQGLTGPWEGHRKVALGAIILIALFLFVVAMLPLGFAALLALLSISFIWKPIGVTNPLLGTYMIQTLPYKVAAFFMALRSQLRTVLVPLVCLGFGPPTSDADHKLEPGWLPPTRLSALWSLLAALTLATLDPLLQALHRPFWGGPKLPALLMYPLSVVGWFAALQIVNAVRRIQGDNTSIIAVEPKPATMVHKVTADIPLRSLLGRSAAYGAAPTALLILVWAVSRWPVWITLILAPLCLIAVAAVSASRIMAREYITGWMQRNERREFWGGVFAYLKDRNPTLVSEAELPTFEEYARGVDPEDPEAPPYNPEIKVATFLFPPNCIFDDYIGEEDRIRGALGVDRCAISPIGNFTPDNQEIGGTIGAQGFRVWWAPPEVELPPLLEPAMDHWMREFLCRSIVIPGLAAIRGIGYCTMLSCTMVTRPESERTIVEVRVIPQTGVNLESFLDRLDQIQTALDVPWVRAGMAGGRAGKGAISLYIGQYPALDKTKFINPQSIVRRTIDQMDWSYFFNAQNLSGTTGVPRLVERRPTTKVVDKMVFELPDGLSFEAVANRLSSLKTTSGNEFMEIELGADENPRMSAEQRIRAEAHSSSRFTIIAAKQDPLKRVFEFGEYRDKLLTGRVPGKAKVEWSPGVLADDQMATYSFVDGGEEPHLLVAGSSGSGKELAVTTPIFTTRGWKQLGEVVVGDVLFDLEGNPTKVVHAFDVTTPERAYDVVLNDGSTIRASSTHLWSVVGAHERTRAAYELRAAPAKQLSREGVTAEVARLRALSDLLAAEDSSTPPLVTSEGVAWSRTDKGEWRPAEWWRTEVDELTQSHWRDPDPRVAILAIPPEVWGLLLVGQYRGVNAQLQVADGELVSAFLKRLGYDSVLTGYGVNTSYITIHSGLGRLLSLVTQTIESEQIPVEVVAAYADQMDAVLLGAAMATARVNAPFLARQSTLEVLARVAYLAGAEVVECGGSDHRIAEIAIEGFDPSRVTLTERPDALAYYAGLRLVGGIPGKVSYLHTSDPGILVELLARGLRATAMRVRSGRARVYVRGVKGNPAAGEYLEQWVPQVVLSDPTRAWQFLAGWSRIAGYRDATGMSVLQAPEERLSPIEGAALLSAAGIRGGVSVEGGNTTLRVLVPELPTSLPTLELMGEGVRHELRFDSTGARVLSIPELSEVVGGWRANLDSLIWKLNIQSTASWHSPTLQSWGTGTVVKASRSTPLYPAAVVLRHLANAVALRAPEPSSGVAAATVLTTQEIADTLYDSPTGTACYTIPIHSLNTSLQDQVPLPVDPYTLGAWLGDGISRDGAICGMDHQVFEEVCRGGYDQEWVAVDPRQAGGAFQTVWFRHKDSGLTLGEQLEGLGLLGPGFGGNKRIPEGYQLASFEDRLALLQGLMDTDGYSNSGFSLSKQDLFEDFVQLARGLGIKVHTRVKHLSSPEHPTYLDHHIAYFTTQLPLHRLKRKLEWRPESVSDRATKHRYIVECRPVPQEEIPPMRCISVDSPTHTYLAGTGLVATHNSVVINSMILQLAYNNGPSELRFWLVEPKNEMQVYRNLDVVDRFVDSWSPDPYFMTNAADLMEEAVQEMNRRYQAMQKHPKSPKQLKKAREIAERESQQNGTPIEDHPLYLPYIVIILEECATLFADASDKEERAEQGRLLSATAEMARKSRAAGMYLVAATQYPTNASIPSVIRNQMARIGLKCQNRVASDVVIGMSGLEHIRTKGVGMVNHKGAYRTFRGYWVKDGDPDYGEANDVLDTVSQVPGGSGQWSAQGGVVVPELVIPSPSETVYTLWDQSGVARKVRRDVGAEEGGLPPLPGSGGDMVG